MSAKHQSIKNFRFIFIFILLTALFALAIPFVYAYTPQVKIPGGESATDLPHYIQAIYNYSLSIIGILATVVIMFGGLLWVMAGGNASKIDNAKSWITAGITGFVLLMMSYTILYMINPNLTIFRKLNPTPSAKLENTGCCEPSGTDGQAYDTVASKCKGSFIINQKAVNGECMRYDSGLGCCIKTTMDGKRTCNDAYTDLCPESSSQTYTQFFFPKKCSYYDQCTNPDTKNVPNKYNACCVKASICHPFNTSDKNCSSNYCRGVLSGEYMPASCNYIDKCKKIGGTCG